MNPLLRLAAPALGAAGLLLSACSARQLPATPAVQGPAAPTNDASKHSQQWSAHVLVTFQEGLSGGEPFAGLTFDRAGNFYGTTSLGGSQSCREYFDVGCGVVFKFDPSGNESIVFAFPPDGLSGKFPEARVTVDDAGNIYGTTAGGGTTSCACGTVFKIDTGGNESVLYSFKGGTDGYSTLAGVVRDRAGNLYGTTYHGGGKQRVCRDVNGNGCGIVYKVDPNGNETVLHRFHGKDGAIPVADLLLDSAGNLYGTTQYGGTGGCNDAFHTGCGTIFEIRKGGTFSVLYNFSTGMLDGGAPRAGLIADAAGNLYGTAYYGGDLRCRYRPVSGCGVVFKLDRTGKETVLHTFEGGSDGSFPISPLVRDSKGNLYGTTTMGGNPNCPYPSLGGCGVVFRLDRMNRETTLYSLTDGADGETPIGAVARDAAGNLFATSFIGVNNYGSVFEVSPPR